jgi:histidine ammonia-lyase
MDSIRIDGEHLSIEDVIKVARFNHKVEISPLSKEKVEKSRRVVEEFLKKGEIVYGITTGFGKFSDTNISPMETAELQKNLIKSHAVGLGEAFSREVVRAIMLLRANALAKGYSGIRYKTIELIVEMLNRGVHPIVPSQGSLGASGDLAPLSHIVLVMMGLGKTEVNGKIIPGDEALKGKGIEPISLAAKEGLALINGTQVMTAIGNFICYDGLNLLKHCDIAAALTTEALRGIPKAFDHKIHALRPHKGQKLCSKNMLTLLEGSNLTSLPGELRVQDAYAIRCIPQVHGASYDSLNYVKDVIEIENNSSTDNPLVFYETGEAISGGNFHGQPVALAMDFAGIAISELANISERRIERLVNPNLSGLPAFLTKHGGLNSGLMITQYTAASIVSENKVYSHPASVDSIPSSANQEDHVSMGTTAARKALKILENSQKVIAIELMAACQGIDFYHHKGLGEGNMEAYNIIRGFVPFLDKDRVLYPDIEMIVNLIKTEKLLEAIEKRIGKLY